MIQPSIADCLVPFLAPLTNCWPATAARRRQADRERWPFSPAPTDTCLRVDIYIIYIKPDQIRARITTGRLLQIYIACIRDRGGETASDVDRLPAQRRVERGQPVLLAEDDLLPAADRFFFDPDAVHHHRQHNRGTTQQQV